MRYLGGKFRQAPYIAPHLNKHLRGTDFYLEPFCGACSVAVRVQHPRMILGDAHPALIAMWRAVMMGWDPPAYISEDVYNEVRMNQDRDPAMTGFVGFGAAWGGKFFGGYARDRRHPERVFSEPARRRLLESRDKLAGRTTFVKKDYRKYEPVGGLIYADPPYEGVTNHKGVPPMNFEEFWATMDHWSETNIVFVSAFEVRPGWDIIIEMNSPTIMNRTAEKANKAQPEYLLRRSS